MNYFGNLRSIWKSLAAHLGYLAAHICGSLPYTVKKRFIEWVLIESIDFLKRTLSQLKDK